MNLSDLLLPAAPGAVGAAPVTAAKGENPQELALFDGFAQVFAVTAPVAEELASDDPQAASELPDGKMLPDETGNILPDLAAPNIASAQAQQFGRHDSALRASERQASYLRAPAQTGQLAQPHPLAAMPYPRPETSRAAPLPEAAQAPSSGSQSQPQPQPQASLAPLRASRDEQASADPAHTDPAKAQHKLHIDLPLRPVTPPAFSSRAATPLVQAEAPERNLAEAQPTPAATAAAQAARAVPIEQMLRPATRSAPAPQVLVEAEATAPGGRPQGTAPAPAVTTQPAPLQPTAPTLVAPEAVRAPIQPAAIEATPTPAPAPQRHDFGQVVERLAEAREMARPGRAEMQVTHREFGPVSLQFDVTGGALKVALANAHAGFAPAVQAALAERPVAAPGEVVRADIPAQQQGQSSAQATGSPPAATTQSGLGQSHGEAQQQQRHNEAPRTAATGQSQPREQGEAGEGDTARRSNPRRDNALFA